MGFILKNIVGWYWVLSKKSDKFDLFRKVSTSIDIDYA